MALLGSRRSVRLQEVHIGFALQISLRSEPRDHQLLGVIHLETMVRSYRGPSKTQGILNLFFVTGVCTVPQHVVH